MSRWVNAPANNATAMPAAEASKAIITALSDAACAVSVARPCVLLIALTMRSAFFASAGPVTRSVRSTSPLRTLGRGDDLIERLVVGDDLDDHLVRGAREIAALELLEQDVHRVFEVKQIVLRQLGGGGAGIREIARHIDPHLQIFGLRDAGRVARIRIAALVGLFGDRLERFGDCRAPDDQFLVNLLADRPLGGDDLVGRHARGLQGRAHRFQRLGLAHRFGAVLGVVERIERLVQRLRDLSVSLSSGRIT